MMAYNLSKGRAINKPFMGRVYKCESACVQRRIIIILLLDSLLRMHGTQVLRVKTDALYCVAQVRGSLRKVRGG